MMEALYESPTVRDMMTEMDWWDIERVPDDDSHTDDSSHTEDDSHTQSE